MRKIQILLISLSLSVIWACSGKPALKLQSGDLLFCEKTSSTISQAIDNVTQTNGNTHFSHVGLVEVSDSGTFVLHASSNGGTCKVSLSEFMHPKGDTVTVVAYRLKEQWRQTIPNALRQAHKLLGKPYNFSYILSDTAHYCSEFIYKAFEKDSIFELQPMTFKDPKTGNFPPAWIEYYKKMAIQIPEGLPGCNPNGLAASDKLERLGKVTSAESGGKL